MSSKEVKEPPSDADFVSYVLYVSPAINRSPACLRALESLTANPGMKSDTLIQNADSLPSRPSWLSSLPCLVIKAEKKALCNEACVQYIQSNIKKVHANRTSRKNTGHKPW